MPWPSMEQVERSTHSSPEGFLYRCVPMAQPHWHNNQPFLEHPPFEKRVDSIDRTGSPGMASFGSIWRAQALDLAEYIVFFRASDFTAKRSLDLGGSGRPMMRT